MAACVERIRSAGHGVLATLNAARGVDAVPVVFAWDSGRILVPVDTVKPKRSTNLRRVRNVQDDPRCVLLVDHYSDDWDELWWVRVDGWASVIEDERGLQEPLDVLASRYEQYRVRRPAGPVILIQADHWKGWSSS